MQGQWGVTIRATFLWLIFRLFLGNCWVFLRFSRSGNGSFTGTSKVLFVVVISKERFWSVDLKGQNTHHSGHMSQQFSN